MNDKLILLQYAINKYNSESLLKEKLKDMLSSKEIERTIDTLLGTQKVRRIGSETLQNNISHAGDLPELSGHLKQIIEKL